MAVQAVATALAIQALDSTAALTAVPELTAGMALTMVPMELVAAPTALTMVPMAYHRRAANEIAPGWMQAPLGACLTQVAKIVEGQQAPAAL